MAKASPSTALGLRLASTAEDAEVVRRIRNAGRDWFDDDHEVSTREQARWWPAALRRDGFCCVLLGEPPIGYGMLQPRSDGRRWVSLAVAPGARGQGAGTEIFRALRALARTGESIYAGIRRDNLRSLAAARRAGYEVDDTVIAPATDPADWIVLRGTSPGEAP